jgi:hypothetical protein
VKIEVVGTFSEVNMLRKAGLPLELIEGRRFTRWYRKHKKLVSALAGIAIFGTMKALKVSPFFLCGVVLPQLAIPVAGTFFSGHGVILLHMLIVGFLTLVVTTFLKFTGRGDLAPLVMFVGGAVILYECMQLFHDIYKGVETFFNM